MNCWPAAVVIFAALFTSTVLAEDFKTIKGKEYKDVTISRVESDGIVLTTRSGISKVYFAELPKDVQERFLPSTPKASAAQGALIQLKNWIPVVKNPTSFLLLLIGVASLVLAGVSAVVRSCFRGLGKKNLTDPSSRVRRRRL